MEDMEDEASRPAMHDDERPITEEGTPESTGETLHVPEEFCPGMKFKPGDEIVMKVVSVGDDGLEVAYAPEKGEESEGEESRASANAELDKMGDGY